MNNGRSWGRRGFQNAHNTHTGGTVLDGYATNYVNDTEGNLPMWNTADAFGRGPLTLKNGAIIKTDANDLNPAFSKLIVDGDGTATNVLYCTNQRFDLRKPVEVTEGNTLHIKYKGRSTWQRFMTGDLTGVKGKIILQAIEDGCQFNIFAGAEYGTLTLAGTVADAEDSSKDYYTEIRFNGSSSITLDDPIKIGMIESAADVTAADAKMGFRANFGSNTGFKNLQIGGSGLSGTYYGSIIRHSNGSDWNVEKVGTGTWTWTSSLHAFDGPLTVAAGRMNINSANLTNCAVVVKSGATLGGTGTLSDKASVTVEEGGILAGSLTFNAGVTFESGAVFDGDEATAITGDVNLAGTVVEVDDESAVTDGRVFLTVTGTATGKPSVSEALAAVEKYNGRRGKWGVTATAENGVTTYSLVWKPTALVVIIR